MKRYSSLKAILIFSLFHTFLMLGGCATSEKKFDSLKIGMTQAEAVKILGEPMRSSSSQLTYRIIGAFGYEEKVVGLANGHVVSWGDPGEVMNKTTSAIIEQEKIKNCSPFNEKIKKVLIGKSVYYNPTSEKTCYITSENNADKTELKIAPLKIGQYEQLKVLDASAKCPPGISISKDLRLTLVRKNNSKIIIEKSVDVLDEKISNWTIDDVISPSNPSQSMVECVLSYDPKIKFKLSNEEWTDIANHSFKKGMSKQAFLLSVGKPAHINITQVGDHKSEQWVMNKYMKWKYIYFDNDQLTAWQN